MISEFFIIIASIAIGYYIGLNRVIEDTQQFRKRAEKLGQIIHNTSSKVSGRSSGVIERPTAEQLYLKNKKKSGQYEALLETFKNIPSLNTWKKQK
jgi:hypothetical protein